MIKAKHLEWYRSAAQAGESEVERKRGEPACSRESLFPCFVSVARAMTNCQGPRNDLECLLFASRDSNKRGGSSIARCCLRNIGNFRFVPVESRYASYKDDDVGICLRYAVTYATEQLSPLPVRRRSSLYRIGPYMRRVLYDVQ